MKKEMDLSLYLVTDRSLTLGRSLDEVVEAAVKGGVTVVQLREKNCSTKEFLEQAIRLKACLKPYGVPLIINDRLDIALACDAEGLHIGQNDMPYETARRILGSDKIIGLSVESMQDIVEANELDVDYIGISPVFDTTTKQDTAKAFGLEGLHEAVKLSKHPAVGIGGINLTNATDIMKAGADGICVVSALMSAKDVYAATVELRAALNRNR